MKKIYKLILSACLTMALTGCGNANNNVQAPDLPDSAAPVTEDFILNNDTVIYRDESGPPEIIINDAGNEQVLAGIEDYPSKPEINTSGEQLAYITPFEFEMIGEVMLYDAKTREQTKVITQDLIGENQSVNHIKWLDDRYLLVTTGYAYGTVHSSRQLYAYDQEDQTFELVHKLADHESIKEIHITDNEVMLDLIQYTDDQFNEYTEGQQALDKASLYEQLKK